MLTRQFLIRHVLRTVGDNGGGVSDGQLLQRFVNLKDEAAFETIVWRHGPMVLGTCRRVLHDQHDAEDAFQATFLVLFRKAASIKRLDSLSSWLYKIAFRVALRAKDRVRLRPGEHEMLEPPVPETSCSCDLVWQELRPVLDRQLDRLPEKYRAPLVLHYLEGKTIGQVARELGWPQGTVSGRLVRARHLLRQRLVHQGLTLSVTAMGAGLAQGTAFARPAAGLVASTIRTVAACATGNAEIISASVAAFTHGVLRTMFLKKIQVASVTAAFCFLAAVVGFLTCQACAGDEKPSPVVAGRSTEAPDVAEIKKDLDGESLPAGAIARMGSARLRQAGLIGPYYIMDGTVAFLPDGMTLFSAGSWSFRFWDTALGRKIGGIDLEKDELPQRSTLAACALAPDGKTLAMTMRYEATIRLLDAATGKEIRRFEGHARGNGTRSVTRIDFSPDARMLASTATDGTLRLWDVATGKEIRKLAPFDPVQRIPIGLLGDINPMVRFSPDGRMLVSKDGGNVRLWEVASGRELHRLQEAVANPQGGLGGKPGSAPVDATFSPDGRVVAVANVGWTNSPSRISLWETLTGKKIRDIEFSSEKLKLGKFEQVVAPTVRAVTFSSDGKTLAAALDTGSFTYESRGIHLYDWTTGRKTGQLLGHKRIVCSLSFSPDNKTLATAAGDGTIRLWDLANGKQLHRGSDGSEIWVETVACSQDGKLVASAGQDNTIAVWDAATGKLTRRIAGAPLRAKPGALYNEKVWSLAFSPNDKMLASGSGDASIYLWDPATGQQIRRLDGHKHWVRAVVFSPDGKTLASASEDKTVRLWNPATGELIREFGGHRDGVRSVAFSRDGKILASVSEHAILLWDPATGNQIPHKANKLQFAGLSMALSPDGKTAVVGGGHGSFEAHLIDLATGNRIGTCPHKDAVWSVAFSPDGKLVASGGHDHKVCLMEAATGKLLARFDAQQGPVFCVAFSSDSKTLLSGGEDTTVLLWDTAHLRRTGGAANPANKKPAEPNQKEPARPDKSAPGNGQDLPVPADKEHGTQELTDKKPTDNTDNEAAQRAAKELEPLWTALASDDAGKAYEAIAALVAMPQKAVPFLKERLLVPPPPPPDSKRLTQLIAGLDSATFSVRKNATDELEKLGAAAEAALRKRLTQEPSPEAGRRITILLKKLAPLSGDQLRLVRAVQALEYAGTPEAKQVLETLAKGAAADRRTREAQESLQRLLKRRQPE